MAREGGATCPEAGSRGPGACEAPGTIHQAGWSPSHVPCVRSLSSPSPSLEAGASRRPGAGEHRPRAPGSSGSCERLGNLIRKASWHLISCTSALNGASLPNSPCLREARAAVTGEQGNEIRRVPARPKVRPGPGGRPRRGGVSAGGGRDGLRCYPSPPTPSRHRTTRRYRSSRQTCHRHVSSTDRRG